LRLPTIYITHSAFQHILIQRENCPKTLHVHKAHKEAYRSLKRAAPCRKAVPLFCGGGCHSACQHLYSFTGKASKLSTNTDTCCVRPRSRARENARGSSRLEPLKDDTFSISSMKIEQCIIRKGCTTRASTFVVLKQAETLKNQSRVHPATFVLCETDLRFKTLQSLRFTHKFTAQPADFLRAWYYRYIAANDIKGC
jgi:hypothetical protein